MSEIIIFKWYSPKKITQYLLLLGLAAGLMPIEKTQAASSVQLVQQQTVNVKGTVLDSHGEPVIGANVVVDNTTQGTITDIDGNFKLSVPMGAKLKISFIGYETQTVVVKNAKMSIVLADDSNVLDEVQIVAYGAQTTGPQYTSIGLPIHDSWRYSKTYAERIRSYVLLSLPIY